MPEIMPLFRQRSQKSCPIEAVAWGYAKSARKMLAESKQLLGKADSTKWLVQRRPCLQGLRERTLMHRLIVLLGAFAASARAQHVDLGQLMQRGRAEGRSEYLAAPAKSSIARRGPRRSPPPLE